MFRILCKCVNLGKWLKGFAGLRIWKEGFDGFLERASFVDVGSGVVRDEIVAIFSLWNGRDENERVL